jgi:dTDP-4-dehydrorhamnose reductase
LTILLYKYNATFLINFYFENKKKTNVQSASTTLNPTTATEDLAETTEEAVAAPTSTGVDSPVTTKKCQVVAVALALATRTAAVSATRIAPAIEYTAAQTQLPRPAQTRTSTGVHVAPTHAHDPTRHAPATM